ncbi:VanW family protein [Paenibacillus filicis]|uniref:VanW family protein n=1 Tax=Paenibacillus gyeongsangnamensis TaxID=3388067 RepID=A0ABT4QDJ5_9BACL|nr:VanW family protein [Paenibacillus filicis]MCZ8514910.1 VanW family protein [Paenibacillus filicis]
MFRFPFRWSWALILALILLVSALASIAVYGSLSRLPAGLKVEDWAVGSLRISDFERQWADKKARLAEQPIALTVHDGTVAGTQVRTLQQLGLQTDESFIAGQLRLLREGSPFRRALYRWKMRNAVWSWHREISMDVLTASLKEAFPQVYARQPVNAKRLFLEGDAISYTAEAGALRIDEAELKERLELLLPTWGSVKWTASLPLCGTGETKSTGTTEPEPEQQAETVSASAAPPAVPLSVPMKTIQPQVTVQSLQAQGIVRKISEFTTSYPQNAVPGMNGEGRIHNVRSTAASIHDVLLKPGEVFDYAPYIQATEKKFGFKEAPVIVNGKLVPGIGGGICQVSSTLYNAVLRAGLAIIERRNHSLPVSYVPLGQDATFASGHIGFKFKNSTDHYLLIRTMSDDRSVTVKLFGQTPQDITYDVESKTLETLQPPVKYVLNPSLKVGKQETVVQGKPGYIVETYRIKKQNGVIIGRERVSRDTYSAQPTIVSVNNGGSGGQDHTPPAPGNDEPFVEDGIQGPMFR